MFLKGKNLTILILAVLCIGLLGVSLYFSGVAKGIFSSSSSSKKVVQKGVDYIESNLLSGQASASLVGDVKKLKNKLYKFKLKVQGQEFNSYITRDGTLLFPQGIKLTKKNESQTSKNQKTSKDIPKKEKPKVELFVQGFCPYGNQAENTMKSVYELLGDKVDWKINFIVSGEKGNFSSLHGPKEVTQDKRELCVLENQGMSKWLDFATYVNKNCGSEGNCWEQAASNTGLDSASISSCVKQKGADLLSEKVSITKERGVSASPTLFINGVKSQAVYNYGSPDAYKKTICSGFKNKPAECEESLSSQKSNSNSAGGSCD